MEYESHKTEIRELLSPRNVQNLWTDDYELNIRFIKERTSPVFITVTAVTDLYESASTFNLM